MASASSVPAAHRLKDETLRIQEYSPGESTAAFAFDPERFAAHENFFVEDVRRWVRSRFDVTLPRERTAGLRHTPRHIRRDQPPTVVIEPLVDELAC